MRDSFIPMQPGIVVMVAAHMMFNGKLASNFNLSTSTSPKSPLFPPVKLGLDFIRAESDRTLHPCKPSSREYKHDWSGFEWKITTEGIIKCEYQKTFLGTIWTFAPGTFLIFYITKWTLGLFSIYTCLYHFFSYKILHFSCEFTGWSGLAKLNSYLTG